MRKTKEQKGITLIALIITIIVLLILAVVAIGAVQNDGIIEHAKNARDQYGAAGVNENATIQSYLDKIKEHVGTGSGVATGVGGNVSEEEKEEVDTITFKVGPRTYTAESGMNWEDWIGSSYCPWYDDEAGITTKTGVEGKVVYVEDAEGRTQYLIYGGEYVNASLDIGANSEYTLGYIYMSGNGNKINFTINGNTYEAEEEMQWGAWIESTYNTLENLIVSDDSIHQTTPNLWLKDADNHSVSDKAFIISGGEYKLNQ